MSGSLTGCGPRPLPPRPPDAAPVIDRIDAGLLLLHQAIGAAGDAALIATATPQLNAISADTHLLGDDNGRLQKLVDAQQAQLVKLNDAGTARDRRTLLWVSIFGLLVVAGGVASLKLLGPGVGSAIATGGAVLTGAAFFMSRSLGAIDRAAPWAVNGLLVFAGIVALAFALPHLWRLWQFKRDTGSAAQDKLLGRGDINGAAALAYAQQGGGDKGWESAKIIQLSAGAPTPGAQP